MKKLFYCCFPILTCLASCQEKKPEDKGDVQNSAHSDSSKNQIVYSDTLIYHKPNWTIEWTVDNIESSDSVFTHKTDPVLHRTVRVIKNDSEQKLMLNGYKYSIPGNIGQLHETVGGLLIFRKYEGDVYSGTITKFICKINKQSIQVLDSIPVGEYGEGWGATDRVISINGDPFGGIIYPDDRYFWDHKNLLVTKSLDKSTSQILLINEASKDTTVDFNTTLKDIRFLRYSNENVIVYNNDGGRKNYLQIFNSKGESEWRTASYTFVDLLVSNGSNLTIATGYSFPGTPDINSKRYFTLAYDLNTGTRIWDFPTAKAYDKEHRTGDRIQTPNMFEISDGVFGLIAGEWANYGPDNYPVNIKNRLIIFDAMGRINYVIDLSEEANRYIFDKIDDDHFNLIGYRDEWSFMLNAL